MISVVINTYNAEEHLRTVLESAKDFDEIVICDMESTDSTLAIARENILDNSLNVGRVTYDETVSSWEDSLSAVVYKQSPYSSSTAPYLMGANVDIYLTMSQAKLFSAQKEAERQAAEPDEQAAEESQTEDRL